MGLAAVPFMRRPTHVTGDAEMAYQYAFDTPTTPLTEFSADYPSKMPSSVSMLTAIGEPEVKQEGKEQNSPVELSA